MVKICNICRAVVDGTDKLDLDDSPKQSWRICLGGTMQTFDLCENCVAKVRHFVESLIEKNTKK